MSSLFLVIAALAFGYAHWKLHMSIAEIKAELLAEIAKLKSKAG